MLADANSCWLVRGNPEGINIIQKFLDNGVIALGWSKLDDLTGKDTNEIRRELSENDYSSSNVHVGELNHFLNNMEVGDICLIPDSENNSIYLAQIKSDYLYDEVAGLSSYIHQRRVEFLNAEEPFNRYELPEKLQKSLRARNSVADISKHLDLLRDFINSGEDNAETDSLAAELRNLLPQALENIKQDIESDDAARRFNASVEVIKLIQEMDD